MLRTQCHQCILFYESLTFFQRRYASVAEETISMMERFLDFLRKSRPQQVADVSSKHQEKTSCQLFPYEHYCTDLQLPNVHRHKRFQIRDPFSKSAVFQTKLNKSLLGAHNTNPKHEYMLFQFSATTGLLIYP